VSVRVRVMLTVSVTVGIPEYCRPSFTRLAMTMMPSRTFITVRVRVKILMTVSVTVVIPEYCRPRSTRLAMTMMPSKTLKPLLQ